MTDYAAVAASLRACTDPQKRHAADVIEELLGVISKGSKWIPVSELMPAPEEDYVLVAITPFEGPRYVESIDVKELHEMVAHCREENETCAYTHWMPLPSAPEAK